MTDHDPEPVLFIVGPTASGKSRLALEIAGLMDSEIVSADSRQIYEGMDIGTAKPTQEERRCVPHHLTDIRTPDILFSAGEYGQLAREAIKGIFSRKRTPIVVGGSGLYIRAVMDGIFEGNYRDRDVRDRLSSQAEKDGLGVLYQKLSELDPEASARIHPNDRKRIVRALEVCELSGKPITHIQKTKTQPADFQPYFYGLDWPRKELIVRIENRVDGMIRAGLVQEVEYLKKSGCGPEHNALDSVGYREVFQFLNGETTFDEMLKLIKINTRRFAKRQMTWFRRDKRIRWISVSEPVDWNGLALEIVNDFQKHENEIGKTSYEPV